MNRGLVRFLALVCFITGYPLVVRAQDTVSVTVDLVRMYEQEQTFPVVGQFVSRQTGDIASQVEGLVEEIQIDIGDRAKEGDILVTLDVSRLALRLKDLEFSIQQAKASVEAEKAQVALLEQELKRVRNLRESAAFNRARHDDLVQSVARARSNLGRTKAMLARAEIQTDLIKLELRDAKIRAPYDGTITARHIVKGDYVQVGETLLSMVNDQNLEIEADISFRQIRQMAEGTIIVYSLENNKDSRLKARVRAVLPEENPTTRTRLVRLVPIWEDDTPFPFVAGQSLILQVPIGPGQETLTVDKDAILMRSGQPWVFIVEDGKATIRDVTLGETVGERFQVLGGLNEGEQVVIRGNERLISGQPVEAYSRNSPPSVHPIPR